MNTTLTALPAAQMLSASQNDARVAELSARKEQRLEKIDAKAKEFEAVFLHEMMEHMFEGIDTGGLFGGGESEEIYRSFMLDEYSKVISQSGGIGVADYVKREMIAMQEKGA